MDTHASDASDADNAPEPQRGALSHLLHAITGLVDTLLATLHTRLELLSTDIQNSSRHASSLLLWSLAALFFGTLGLIFAALTLIIIFWDTHRVLAAVLVASGFLGFSVIAAWWVAARLRSMPRLFDATLAELERDRDRLRAKPGP